MRPTPFRLALLSTTIVLSAAAARAQGADGDTLRRMNAIEGQIRSLQDELRAMRRDLAARDSQLRAAQRDAAQARQEAQRAQGAARPGVQTAAGRPAGGPAGGSAGGSAAGAVPDLRASSPGPAGGSAGAQEEAGQQNASTTPAPTPMGTFRLGGVTITLGGFVEGAGIYRSRNEVADIASNFNTGIPLLNTQTSREGEARFSAHQSRVSLLVTGNIDPVQKLTAYFETDFQSAGTSSNSVQSNSYGLRLRQAFASYDNSAWGLHVLGGQAWSLLTPTKVGITPRSEDLPLVIDAQYVVGFPWSRQAQFRVAGDFFDHRLWAGLSVESPQAVFFVGPNGTGAGTGSTVNYQNAGGSGLNATANYSADLAPDLVAKLAADPGFGHYEVFGLMRLLRTRVSVVGSGSNKTALAGGGGTAFVIPVIKDVLEIHGNALAGIGIGRYGSAQLPDATLGPSGAPRPLPEVEAMIGLVAHPVPSVDLYGYVGTEQVGRRAFASGGKGYGYGSPLYVNTGCATELSASPCQANTSGVVEGTVGGWWRFVHGGYGTAQVGAQYEYLRRQVFGGVGGGKGTDDNVVLISFRYLPFQ